MAQVEREILLPAPLEEVWETLVDATSLSEWFGADVAIERVAAGGKLEFRWPDGTVRGAVLEEVSAPVLLAFRWLPFERRPSGPAARDATRVVITLAREADATRFAVVESAAFGAMSGSHLSAVGGPA